MLDLDAESYPLRPAEGAAVALAEKLGCPSVALDPAAAMREQMAAVLRVPAREATMLYVAHDGAADERFCAAALSELLTVCAPSDVSGRFRAEDALVANFDPLEGAGSARIAASCGGGQALSEQALPHLVLKAREYIYVMEFKFDGTAEEAIRQINEKGYAAPFKADGRRIVKLGINFSRETKTIDKWIVEEE